MFIAHLPAGYLLNAALIPASTARCRALWATGLFFAVAPDLDLLWFYLASDRSIPHHQYITHWPLLWAVMACLASSLCLLLKRPAWLPFIGVAFANVLLHLILDSVAAEIYWLAPFSRISINLVRVPAHYSWWVWNFFLHWTFAVEAGLCLAAAALFVHRRRSRP